MINTELRVGNLILLDGKDIETVTGINTKEVRIENYFYDIERISGIPLTESMLEKLGFDKIYKDWYEIKKTYIQLSISVTKQRLCIDTHSGQAIFDLPFNSVHALQNWFYSNTGTELTYTEK